MKYINNGGERIDVPETYYTKYTDEEWKKEFPDGFNEGCSCGMTFSGSGKSPMHDYGHDGMVNDRILSCKCYCHGYEEEESE